MSEHSNPGLILAHVEKCSIEQHFVDPRLGDLTSQGTSILDLGACTPFVWNEVSNTSLRSDANSTKFVPDLKSV